jgi:serine protease Do
VASVTDAGPAAKAGIQAGDVILTFDGKPVPNMRVLPRVVAETNVGREVDVEIVRKGKHQTVRVVLGELPEEDELAALEGGGEGGVEEPETEKAISKLGMAMATITPDLRERYQIGQDVAGVVVTGVEAGSPAETAGIAEGDVLVEVAQNQVADPSDVAEAVDEAQKADAHKIVVLLDRQGDRRFVALDSGEAAN